MHLCPVKNKNNTTEVISVLKTSDSLITNLPLIQDFSLDTDSDNSISREGENLAFQMLRLVLDNEAAIDLAPYFFADVIATMQSYDLCYLIPISEITDWAERNLNESDGWNTTIP